MLSSFSKLALSNRRSVFQALMLSVMAHFVGHPLKRPRRASRYRPHQGKQEIARRRRQIHPV